MLEMLMIVAGAYLVGAIPTAALFGRYLGLDITQHGSGNSGATNAGRVLGFKYFFIVLLIDVFKAFIVIRLLQLYGFDEWVQFGAALALLVGNSYSLFLAGKGGKSIGTSVGMLIAFQPLLLNWVFMFWSVGYMLTKSVGMASVIGLVSLPLVAWWLVPVSSYTLFLCVLLSLWGIWRHRMNVIQYVSSLS